MFNRPALEKIHQNRATSGAWVRGLFFLVLPLMGGISTVAAMTPPAKSADLPFYIYGDESGARSQFVPSGFMGDTSALSILTSSKDESAPASTGRLGITSMNIEYTGKGKQGWAGVYWLAPANNWGTIKGAGFDFSAATKLTFWLRGKNGGEKISQVKVGGINGPYPDSGHAFMGPIVLTKEWKQYELDLKGKDLRHIIGGFMFTVRRADNPKGASFFLDQIAYQGAEKAETPAPQAVPSVTNEK